MEATTNNRVPQFIFDLKNMLVTQFQDDINKLVLFGSVAKGKAKKNSDYDVLIVLNRDYDWKYKNKIIDLCYEIDLKHNVYIDSKIISVDELNNSIKGLHPIYKEALTEGITI